MNETLAEWIIVLIFFLLVVGFTFAEAVWLSKKGWAGFGKSFAASALSNLIGFCIGLFVFFVVLGVFMMLSFGGSLNNFPLGDFGMAAVLILAGLFTPFLLIICKRIFLAILKIQTGKSAWLYALVSSVLIFVVSLDIPILISYIFYR